MQEQAFNYINNDIKFKGKYFYKENNTHLPAVLVAHDWSGCNEFAQTKARQLAQLGFVGIAIDMYGEGKIGQTLNEKKALIAHLLENRVLITERMQAALAAAQKIDIVDKDKIAAIGLCFGGLCVLDLARSGASLKGVASIHGLLNPPSILSKTIKAKILVLHGYDDPMVPPSEVKNFCMEMTKAKADWQMLIYGNVMHAFSNPQANDPKLGTVYDKSADKRSWLALENFLNEILA